MHEIIDKIPISHSLKMPKLKGHTKIELTDVNTGEVEVIESDNMVTDGLESWMNRFGHFNSFISGTAQCTAWWKTLLGGILLIDSNLPTTAKYMPASAKMVGNCYYQAVNAGVVTEMGSYNVVESSATDDQVVLVYDWLTSQANGTIRSISLTTRMGGYMGYGNETSRSTLDKWGFLGWQGSGAFYVMWNYSTSTGSENSLCEPLIVGNHLYCHNRGSGTAGGGIGANTSADTEVVVYYTNIDITEADVLLRIPNQTSTGGEWDNRRYPISEWHYTISFMIPPHPNTLRCCLAGTAFPDCYLWIPDRQLASGASCDLYLMDVTQERVVTLTIYNNTGLTIQNSDWSRLNIYLLDDTYMFCRFTDGTHGKVNYRTGELVGLVANNIGVYWYHYSGGLPLNEIAPNIYAVNTSGASSWLYNSVKNTFTPFNGSVNMTSSDNNYTHQYRPNLDAIDFTQRYYRDAGSNYIQRFHNPLRLMTINNLPEPVVKTPSKTMKVTYTISRASS